MAVNMSINDPAHELFLNPSDNPNNILVSELMNGDNYGHWKKAMEVALIAKNKLGFALGTCSRPAAGSSLEGQWNRCDKMVLSWIINAVVKDIGQSLLFSSSTNAVWLQLEQRFGEADDTRIFKIQRDLCTISQNNLSVADYFTQIKKLWDDYNSLISIPLCNCGIDCASFKSAHKIIQDQQLMQFLVGLNEDYKIIRGSILMMKPLNDRLDTTFLPYFSHLHLILITLVSRFGGYLGRSLMDDSLKSTLMDLKVRREQLEASSSMTGRVPLYKGQHLT